jgi:hypothetical protein
MNAQHAPIRPVKVYEYPRSLLEQPYFVANVPNGCASLSTSQLGHPSHFASPLMTLLSQMREDGHNVDAPLAEATALFESAQRSRQMCENIADLVMRARLEPSSVAGIGF